MDKRVDVRMTETMGRGVFAREKIPAGSKLGEFFTLRIEPIETPTIAASPIGHFWFEDDTDGAAYVVFGWLSLINHAEKPNISRIWSNVGLGWQVAIEAARDVAPGEQLFIDYGFDKSRANLKSKTAKPGAKTFTNEIPDWVP
jgi:uncharacterized protein